MEKKAKHFVRLLARELYENEQTRVTGPVNIAAVKHAFRNALNDLPKSALKTELQRNAATYSRRLEALTKSARDDSSKSSKKGTNIEENEPKKQQESNNANTDDLRSSETKEKEACCQSKKTSDQKGLTKSTSEAVFSSFTHTEDRGNEERINDTVAMATPSEDKTEVADLEQGEASDSGSWSFAYNVYATDARSRVIESLAKLHSEKRQRLAPHAYASLCSTNSYFEFLQALYPVDNLKAPTDTLAVLKQEILSGLGMTDVKIFIRSMADCLSGVILEADKVLESKDSRRLKELQEFLLNFLQWAKMQNEVYNQKQDQQVHSLTNFDDLMAAILSIYIDVGVVLSRDSPDTAEAAGRLTLSQILLLIGPSPVQQLNLLLQVTQPSSQDCHFMIPIYRHMLSSKPSVMTNEAFIKYICAIRFSQQILMNQKEQAVLDVLQHIMGIAMTAEPSIEFLQWLYSTAPDAYSSLPDSVKSTTSLLVKYLTGEASRDYLDRLLDIVCDEEIESQTLSYKDSQSEPRLSSINSQDNQAEISETEGLFFTDTSRDEDLARQVDSDSELVDALHSRLDALIEGIDQEENSEDDDNFVQVGKPSNVKVQSEKNGIAALMSLDSDNQSDYEEVDMDTSGTVTSEQNAPEALSFEEQRYKLQMKAQKKVIDVSDASQNEEGGTPRMRGKSRNQKPLSLSSRRDEEEVLVIPETQDNRPERDSDRESFATAKDNLDSTRESVIIDVDEEITFRVKAAHQRSHKDGDPQAEDVEKQNKDSVVNLEDEEQVRDTSSPSSYKPSRTKAKSRHLQSSQETVGKPNKKQEQASDEMSGSTQRMSLRSVSAGHNQSSLLRFFSPVSRNIDESNSQPDQNPESGKISQLDRVEIVPDSYSSFDEEIEKYDQRRKIRASQRFKNLKSLQRIRANSKQEESPGISQLPEGINSTPAPTKQNRLSRSGRKMGSTRKQVIYSSNSGEEPAILDSPILRPSQTCEPRSQASDQKSPAVEDVVSEGIRRIWEECTTASSDLPTSVVTKSASKRKPPKRKSLTITGGIKSKSLAVSTPRQPTKQAEGPTPAEKTVSESAEKPQGVSPLSPSKVKRVATFGDTYRLLAGISADSQSDPCSLPASQSQKTSPKRARLQPKALKMMFDKDTPSNQKRSAKTQTADFQEISASSQESNCSFVAKKPSRKPRRLASPSKKTPVRTSSKSSQESSAGQARQGKRAMTRESPYASLRFDDADSPKTAVKRRASLFVSQTTTKAESNVKRKSTGTAT